MGGVRTKLSWIKYGVLLLLALYVMRFYWVESRREYSQDGVLRVLFDTVPEIRGKKIDIWANGIGCHYSWRLQHCIGLELGNAASTVPDLAERFSDVVNNFCAIVEKKYVRESYAPVTRPITHEVYLDLSQAYSIYFDCKNSRKPIGEVRLYISNEAKTTNDSNKARLIAKI
ncbi:MAG: hypothetical protein ACYC05_14705 [Sulfuricella sp.]